jgi:hypothetical protein
MGSENRSGYVLRNDDERVLRHQLGAVLGQKHLVHVFPTV